MLIPNTQRFCNVSASLNLCISDMSTDLFFDINSAIHFGSNYRSYHACADRLNSVRNFVHGTTVYEDSVNIIDNEIIKK